MVHGVETHFETYSVYKMSFIMELVAMKTITVRELKAQWAAVEAQVRNGETFEVLNRGKPAARIVPALPRSIVQWDDHLTTALTVGGKSAEETVREDRNQRW